MSTNEQNSLILVRATVNLPGLAHNTEALIDPDDPYMKSLLENTMLVRVRARRPAAAAESREPGRPDGR